MKIYKRVCNLCKNENEFNNSSSYYDSLKRYDHFVCKKCRKLNTILNRPKRDKLFKFCSRCGKKQTYSKVSNLNLAIRRNSMCYECNRKKYIEIRKNENYIKPCPICNKKLKYANRTSYKRSIKENNVCKECIKFIKKYNPKYNPNYNEKACEYLDRLNKEKGWNLRHAKNNGSEKMVLWYYPDGYDKERNIIVEYDESHHYNKSGELKEKDIRRMNEIINHLHCKFYRYNEKTKELKEYELE